MTDCTHHWVLETPNGEFAQGYCKHCRIVRGDFRNAGPEHQMSRAKHIDDDVKRLESGIEDTVRLQRSGFVLPKVRGHD